MEAEVKALIILLKLIVGKLVVNVLENLQPHVVIKFVMELVINVIVIQIIQMQLVVLVVLQDALLVPVMVLQSVKLVKNVLPMLL